MSWKKEKKQYQKRFHTPLFPNVAKTTTVRGKRDYQKLYMRRLREIKRVTK